MELTQEALTQIAAAYIAQDRRDHITKAQAISQAVVDLRICDTPVFGLSDAADPLYPALQAPEAVGPWFLLPEDWLPGARTVISLFLPFTKEVQQSNRTHKSLPSEGWLHSRYEGQALIFDLCRYIAAGLEAAGYRAVIPSLSPRFSTVEEPGTQGDFPPEAGFTSLWSERHAAYVSGLGTFGLSGGLITARGMCGRFGSIVTDAPGIPTPRDYTDIYEYCTRCGACVRRCPVKAIDLETGKNHLPCSRYVAWTERKYAPRYGCGKCQVGVPCAAKRPTPAPFLI